MKSDEVAPGVWHRVRRSTVHGTGVFATRNIPPGTVFLEYLGERISAEEADRRHPANPADPFHTFYFATALGDVIDGTHTGNDAKWINHSCEPNCEAQESAEGRIFIATLRPIARGEELFYDYGLVIEARKTRQLCLNYRCLCGTASCRGTLLALDARQRKRLADLPRISLPLRSSVL